MNCIEHVAKNIPKELNSLAVVQALLNLSKCFGSDSVLFEHTDWFGKLTNFIKTNIRTLDANHLAGMIFYCSELNHFQNNLWYHYEMQVGRTNITTLMNNLSLVKTAEAFAKLPPSSPIDTDEVFMQIRLQLLDRAEKLLKQESTERFLPPEEFSKSLYVFSSRNESTPEFLEQMSTLLKEGLVEELTNEDWARVLWSYGVAGQLSSTAFLKAQSSVDLEKLWGNLFYQAKWAYCLQN